jgi:hypothetical protein
MLPPNLKRKYQICTYFYTVLYPKYFAMNGMFVVRFLPPFCIMGLFIMCALEMLIRRLNQERRV